MKKGLLYGCGGAIVMLVVLIAIGAAVAGNKGAGPSPSPAAGTSPISSASPVASAAPVTLIDVQGNGIKQTQSFVAPNSWSVSYSWQCSNQFSFSMYVEGDAFDVITNSATQGSDTAYEHKGGNVYLSINSPECNWHVTAKG